MQSPRPIWFLPALAVALMSARAIAQCRTFTLSFAGPPNQVYSVAVQDFGAGPQLFIADREYSYGPPVISRGAVLRWTGSGWENWFETTPAAGSTPQYIDQIIAGTDANGPLLALVEVHVVGAFNPPCRVWRFDGSAWSALGDFSGRPQLALLDEGAGPQLIAYGNYFQVSGTPINKIARWNGTAWSGYGAGPSAVPLSVTVFDSGSGRRLHAGLDGAGVARWDGGTWSPLGMAPPGAIHGLEVLDSGAGPELYAAINHLTGSALARWNGTDWNVQPGIPARVLASTVADLGSGPRIYLAGPFGSSRVYSFDGGAYTPAGSGPNWEPRSLAAWPTAGGTRLAAAGPFITAGGLGARGLATWNGASWSHLGGPGLDGRVAALCTHDFGAGPQLIAGGEISQAQGSPATLRVARWTGSAFAPLAGGLPTGLYALGSLDVAGTRSLFAAGELWQQGSVYYGGIARWNGTAWATVGGGLGGLGFALAGHDDGSGSALYVAGQFTAGSGGPGARVARWNGTSWSPLASGVDDIVYALGTYDEGAGEQLFAAGQFTSASGVAAARIARWNGASWSALGAGLGNGQVLALCTFDDGAGEGLYAGGTFTLAGGAPVSYLARWNGTSWSNLPGGGANGAVLALHVHDDGRGPALYVGGGFGSIGGITAYNLARFDGASWEPVDGGFDGAVRALGSDDDDGDGDAELFVGGDFKNTATSSNLSFARLEGCPHYESFCFGDGTLVDHTTPCPCANDGAPGHGCANAFDPNGALLQASGGVSPDTLVLAGSGMPLTAFGIYLQHDALDERVFHDGVICAGGNLIRLRNRNAAGGSSTYPNSSDTQTVSQRGQVTPGSGATRYYSLFYRAASPTFCPPATANVTNGVRVIW